MMTRIYILFVAMALAFWNPIWNPARAAEATGIKIIDAHEAEISRDGGNNWDPAGPKSDTLKPGHRLRTAAAGWALLELTDKARKRVGPLSSLIVPGEGPATRMRFFRGIGYFFNRDKPGGTEAEGPLVGAVVKGTEFLFEVNDAGESKVTVLEGSVTLTNALGEITIAPGHSGAASSNTIPQLLPSLVSDVPGTIQWALYYPAVLDVRELPFSADEKSRVEPILNAYESGDLRAAAVLFSDAQNLNSPAARLLGAALDLVGGRVAEARIELARLKETTDTAPQARALEWLIDAVQFKIRAADLPPLENCHTASELLGLSYARQSLRDLPGALEAARAAAEKSPAAGFAWTRVAELQFSFGRARESADALEKALRLSPRNAQAAALQGFAFAAQNKIQSAAEAFDRAIALDGALANGWLGRGLLRIRSGDEKAGESDLLTAAALEPQRSFLRSYLAKSLDLAGNSAKARHELDLARQLDPADPTPLLYAALLDQNSNRINDAVRNLEASQDRVANRGVYRSEFLLDQDRAVRSAHLANIYRDAGMEQPSRLAAANSLASDFANPSAHLFLAESYLSLDRVNLRYEGARVSEYLTANLLAPAGAGAWSPGLSQQEYSALFERDGAGLVSSTEYRSNGRWLQTGAGYANWRGANATLDGLYLTDPGYRPNNDLQISSVSFQYKQQITPDDTFYLQPLWSSVNSGDLIEYYNDTNAIPGLRVRETQDPILLAGWRHDWSPQSKTILLAGYLTDDLHVNNTNAILARIDTAFDGRQTPFFLTFDQHYRSQFEAGTIELQHILQHSFGDTIVGAHAQFGTLRIANALSETTNKFPNAIDTTEAFDAGLDRFSAYAYQSWKPIDRLELVAGLAYDTTTYPSDFRLSPLAPGRQSRDQLSPKAGLVADLWRGAVLHAAYAQSLGGIGFDQSFRIEPSQVAGINQHFRSMIPEAVAGSNSAERMELSGLDLSQQIRTNTWLTLSALWLSSRADRQTGLYVSDLFDLDPIAATQNLAYRERTLQFTLNQLIRRDLALGATYTISEATFHQTTPGIVDPAARAVGFNTDQKAILQQATLFAVINHPSGLFGRAEAIWTHQDNRLDLAPLTGDDFWQENLFAGYRFAKRHIEITAGLLNVSDNHYHLYPLNLHPTLARERTFFLSLKWSL